ncbi:MAG: TonB-dependent receptor [Proteobacteria bacterium]|nr:TonB-dependent receptor [Pseudomonadota bacterium]
MGNTSDRLNGATQDGTAFFGEGTWNVTDAWSVTAGYRHHTQDNSSQGVSAPGDPDFPTIPLGQLQTVFPVEIWRHVRRN